MNRADAKTGDEPRAAQVASRFRPAGVAWDGLIPSWPLIVGLAVFGRQLAVRLALLHDPDTYLHIATGNWILAHRMLPMHDPFSHSMPGATWLSAEWLAQIILAVTYDALGWAGPILLTATSVAVAIAILTHYLLRRLEPLPALIATIAATALLLQHVLARPHIVALPLLVLWSALLFRARDDGRGPPFLALPVIVLWANLHGTFMFGLALAAFLGGEAVLYPGLGRSRWAEGGLWAVFVLVAIGAALVTPFGVAGLMQPIRLSQMPALQSTFSEWLSPNFQTSPVLEMWILGMLFIGFAIPGRMPMTRLVLLLGLVHMTLQHVRHADLLAVVGPLAVAAPLARNLAELAGGEAPSRLISWATRLVRRPGLAAVALIVAIGVAFALPTALRPIVRPDDMVTPGAALAAAQRMGLTGPVFNSEAFGGYLIFRGVPTFIDGRIEMYGNDFLAQEVKAEHGDEAVLTQLLARYHIAWALLMPGEGADEVLSHLAGWQRVYADKYAVVFRRTAKPL